MDLAPPSPPLLQYAGFWWRFLAWALDALILCAIYAIMLGAGDSGLATFIISWLYYALCESSRWQGTLGKRACKLIVVDEETNSISFARASGRYFAKILSMLTLGIGYIMAAFTRRKQALHDIIAGTLVLRLP